MNWMDPTPEHIAEAEKWAASRPPAIKALAERFKPWKLYRLDLDNGRFQRVTVVSFVESGSHMTCAGHRAGEDAKPHCATHDGPMVRVAVLRYFNALGFERHVMVKPDELTECDLPPDDELVGSADLTDAEIKLPERERGRILLARAPGVLRPFREIKPTLPSLYR